MGGRGCANPTFFVQMVPTAKILAEIHTCFWEECQEGYCGLGES